VGWITTELILVTLAAMMSPTTLTFTVLTLVLGERPLRTGLWFFLGAAGATLAIGVIAAFVIGDAAATSHPDEPKTWVAILDVVFAVLLAVLALRLLRSPPDPEKTAKTVAQMGKVASSPAIAIVGAGAALANPGAFIPVALKTISELDPSSAEYVADWIFFTIGSLLPLLCALVALVVARDWALGVLGRTRGWLERRAVVIGGGLALALAAVLLRNGIAGLTS
jgi:hypothetical protein